LLDNSRQGGHVFICEINHLNFETPVADQQNGACLRLLQCAGLHPGTGSRLPLLNSFFLRSERELEQTKAPRKLLAEQHFNEPLVLVSHQVNITALTGIYPASGEPIGIRMSNSGAISVVGTTKTD
jgi:hypothetical protein